METPAIGTAGMRMGNIRQELKLAHSPLAVSLPQLAKAMVQEAAGTAVALETADRTMAAGAPDGGIKVVARPDAMYL